MNVCEKCGAEFPVWVEIKGKKRNLCNRKYCLDCSPFGQHNTKNLECMEASSGPDFKVCLDCQKQFPIDAFYKREGSKRVSYCKGCITIRTRERKRKNKLRYVTERGGQCSRCGYGSCLDALEFHHIDPEQKDHQLIFTARKKVEKEIEKCELVCSNCHHEIHYQYDREKALNSRFAKKSDDIKLKALIYKGGACICCGYDQCAGALQFHHRDPSQKDIQISRSRYSWGRIQKELDKCDLVCANCHREVHEKMRESALVDSNHRPSVSLAP